MSRRDTAVVEELARLLDGELTADEAAAPVAELARLASTVTAAETLARPTPAFRAALRNQLVADIQTAPVGPLDRLRDAAWERTARWRHSARVAIATATASTLIGTAGVAAAAQQALPGELLYGIKRTTESVQLAFAGDLAGQGRFHLSLAERRLDELSRAVDSLDEDQAVDTLDAMDEATVDGANALIAAVEEGLADASALDELAAFSTRQRDGLAEVYGSLPSGARPFADDSFEVLRRVETRVSIVLDGACESCGGVVDGVTAPGPGDRPAAVVRPGEGPAVPDRPLCDCVPVEAPAPPRDPGVMTTPDGGPATSGPVDGPDTDPATPDEAPSVGVPTAVPTEVPTVLPPAPDLLEPTDEPLDSLIGDLIERSRPGSSPGPGLATPAPSAAELPDATLPTPGDLTDPS